MPDGRRAYRSAGCGWPSTRAAHHRPSPVTTAHQHPHHHQRASAHRHDAPPTQCRVAAVRAAATRRPRRSPALTTGLVARKPKTLVARRRGHRGGERRRCARGNLKAVAEGDNEDDEGAVRSEGSGPQSWAIASPVTTASGDLRRLPPREPVSNTRERRSTMRSTVSTGVRHLGKASYADKRRHHPNTTNTQTHSPRMSPTKIAITLPPCKPPPPAPSLTA